MIELAALTPPQALALAAACMALAGLLQAAAGVMVARRFRAMAAPAGPRPAISVLKPLSGDEALLDQALTSFCVQDYPAMQLVFGVQSANDPAIDVVERLRRRFPAVDIDLVIDPTIHGANHKVDNLINMLSHARHQLLVVSDSDMHVPPDFLARVADALAVPGTGLVTTLYTGLPARPGIAGQLGSAHITQSFAAGALMARVLGRQDCLGATMALTRDTLARVGGFAALSPYVADDAVLGMKVRALGHNVALAACVPATTVSETSLRALFAHELRWARTIRAVAPRGFALSIVQYPGFWGALALILSGFSPWAWALWATCLGVRALCGRLTERCMGSRPTPFWLAAPRDMLSMAVILAAYLGDDVAWRGHKLSTMRDSHVSAARLLVGARRGWTS